MFIVWKCSNIYAKSKILLCIDTICMDESFRFNTQNFKFYNLICHFSPRIFLFSKNIRKWWQTLLSATRKKRIWLLSLSLSWFPVGLRNRLLLLNTFLLLVVLSSVAWTPIMKHEWNTLMKSNPFDDLTGSFYFRWIALTSWVTLRDTSQHTKRRKKSSLSGVREFRNRSDHPSFLFRPTHLFHQGWLTIKYTNSSVRQPAANLCNIRSHTYFKTLSLANDKQVDLQMSTEEEILLAFFMEERGASVS